MINAISKVTLYVNNQEEAKAFWTERVGFEVRSEEQMGPDMKWIEVGPAQGDTTVFVLYDKKMMEAQNPKVNVGHPSVMMSTDNIEEAYKELLEKGVRRLRGCPMEICSSSRIWMETSSCSGRTPCPDGGWVRFLKACLNIVFRQMSARLLGKSGPNEGRIAGWVT